MSAIPDGWVLMSSYDTRLHKKHGNPGDDYRMLLEAKTRREIRTQSIPGVRGVLVVKKEADAYLEANRKPSQCQAVAADAHPMLDDQERVFRESILEFLERIAVAVERSS
jgi:hypothetical protein